MNEEINPTFTHQQLLQYSLTCTLHTASSSPSSLHLSLHVPTDSFPKIYHKTLSDLQMTPQMKIIFGCATGLYRAIKDKTNLELLYNWGIVRVKYGLLVGAERRDGFVEIRMDRSMENQLDEIRSIIGEKVSGIGDFEYLDSRIDKIWKRKQENQKIFLKFKQDMQFRIEQVGQRMNIQNTKMSILRQDLNKLLTAFDKLASITCPIFAKLNTDSEYTSQFILQDRKIMYIGDSGTWTQILMRSQLGGKGRVEFSFKIVNTKRSNIVVGVTMVAQAGMRSSLSMGKGEKGDRKFIGFSGMGHLYSHQFASSEMKNLSVVHHHQSQKQRSPSSRQKQHKSNHQITLSSPPIASSIKSPTITTKTSNPSTSHNFLGHNSEAFKPMQIIKMCIEFEKERISWKNGSKVLMETKIGVEFRSETCVPYFQFCDTGDSVQCIDF